MDTTLGGLISSCMSGTGLKPPRGWSSSQFQRPNRAHHRSKGRCDTQVGAPVLRRPWHSATRCPCSVAKRPTLRIEITGPIGSGKTTLAAALSSQPGWELASETPESIPFWADAYGGTQNYLLEKDLSFLIFHSVQVRELQSSAEIVVCDFSFHQDLAYARLSETAAELAAYTPVHGYFGDICGRAELIVNLRCSTDTLLDRIRQRGRPEEKSLDGPFLKRLVCEIDAVLAEQRPPNLIELDSEIIDFRRVSEVIKQVLPLIRPVTSLMDQS